LPFSTLIQTSESIIDHDPLSRLAAVRDSRHAGLPVPNRRSGRGKCFQRDVGISGGNQGRSVLRLTAVMEGTVSPGDVEKVETYIRQNGLAAKIFLASPGGD
jgi:hypothetical protein